MSFIKSIRRLLQATAGIASPQPLPSRSGLTETVCRERARADRSGGEFSVITFTAASPDSQVLERVAMHVAQRVRIIDEYGLTEERNVWLLLFDCPSAPAAKLAQDLCDRFSTPQQTVSYELYHYAANSGGSARNRSRQTPIADNRGDGHDRSYEENAGESSPEAWQPVETVLVRATPRWKRAMDVLASGTALIVLSPVLAVVALLVKTTSRGPIFFAQVRAGRAGKPFRMYKFRTMVVEAEELKAELMAQNEQDGPAFKMKNDPRVTSIGRLLRSTGIDELPQLWNVLRGEMSLVGPRPLPMAEAEECMGWHQERLDVAPGLTCTWQVCDRGVEFADWMRMDIRYARKRSLLRDLVLVLQTLAFVIRRRGT